MRFVVYRFLGFGLMTKARMARTACVAQSLASIVRGSITCVYNNHSVQALSFSKLFTYSESLWKFGHACGHGT